MDGIVERCCCCGRPNARAVVVSDFPISAGPFTHSSDITMLGSAQPIVDALLHDPRRQIRNGKRVSNVFGRFRTTERRLMLTTEKGCSLVATNAETSRVQIGQVIPQRAPPFPMGKQDLAGVSACVRRVKTVRECLCPSLADMV